MSRYKLGLTACAAIALTVGPGHAAAYTPTDDMKPTDLRVAITLASEPAHNNWTRYVTFENLAGSRKSVAVAFSKTSALHYEGVVTSSGLADLQSLAEQNNRSYWDKMYFENKGGSTALSIASISIEIEYANTCCGREATAMIAYNLNLSLGAGKSSVRLSEHTGRMVHAMDYFGWTYLDLMALPDALRYFIYDAGKSGSSDSSDSASSTNPKYASSGSALCSETVSWYYYTYGVVLTDSIYSWITYDFRDVTTHGTIHDYFKYADRLYCYHSGYEQWIKKDRDYNWVLGESYEPRPGDYLDRRASDPANGDDGHAMMLIRWDAAAGVADVIDGPYNINFLPVDVRDAEIEGRRDYCVGRIPFND
jgi:hypothetical protein